MSEVVVRLERSDGVELILNTDTWKIPSDGLEGFGSFKSKITTVDNTIIDGSIISNKRIEHTDRTIKAICADKRNNEACRREVSDFFITRETYNIYVKYMGRERWAEGHLLQFKCDTGNIYNRVQFSATFLFPDPYLLSVDNFGQDIASIGEGTGFPYISPIGVGSPTGVFKFAQEIEMFNDGDVSTYLTVNFIASDTVVNPKIIINGKFVRILDTMHDGDIIIIDFNKQPPTVRKNGVNIVGKADRASSFDNMTLLPKNNIISYDADNGTGYLQVSLFYNKRYLIL